MSKLLLVTMLALVACNGQPSRITSSPAPLSCPGELTAVVTNDGRFSLDVYNGETNLGTIRPGASERFALVHGGRVSVRIPKGQTIPAQGRDRTRVQYVCGR
jgi:hypothetical protein